MPDYAENMLTITACPVCAKNGKGRGDIRPYHRAVERGCLTQCILNCQCETCRETDRRCITCGWMGNSETVQSYLFPCWTYRVVEMDLSVVENLLSMARQLPEREEIKFSFNVKTGDVIDFAIEANFEEPTVKWGLRDALCYLVTTGWLFPAIYKIEIDV